MIIDTALSQIKAFVQCWVIWRSDTGEIVTMAGFLHEPTSEEFGSCLQSLEGYAFPVMGRLLMSAQVTRETLEEEAANILGVKARVAALDNLKHQTTEQLIEMLETQVYPPHLSESDSSFLVELLFYSRRNEWTGMLRDRLQVFAQSNRQIPGRNTVLSAARILAYYLAFLDGDAARLISIWKGEPPGYRCYAEQKVLIECLGFLHVRDATIIDDLIRRGETPTIFGLRFDAMVALGRIGAAVGQRAVDVIKAAIYDSSEYVTSVRERVCERILIPSSEWISCPHCDYGRMADEAQGYLSLPACRFCLGIGFVRHGTA